MKLDGSLHENTDDEDGDENASGTESHRSNGPCRFGPQVNFWYWLAKFLRSIGQGTQLAGLALRLIPGMPNL